VYRQSSPKQQLSSQKMSPYQTITKEGEIMKVEVTTLVHKGALIRAVDLTDKQDSSWSPKKDD